MLKKNQRVEIIIEDMGSEGQGIGRVDGLAIFVEGGLPGELLEILILKLKKHYGYGKILRILTPSPHRVTAPCPVFRQCGGCSLMHMEYEAQLQYKTNKVAQCLKRIGGFDVQVENTIGMEQPLNYRNKGQYPCQIAGEGRETRARFGFYSSRSHRLVPVTGCLIQQPINDTILKNVEDFMAENCLAPYDELSHRGLLRHVLIRSGQTGEILVVIVINGSGFPGENDLAKRLMEIPGVCGVLINVNRERSNVILGNEGSGSAFPVSDTIPRAGRSKSHPGGSDLELFAHATGETAFRILGGKGFLTDTLGSLRFEISPQSFFQVNPAQTKVLYDTAVEYAAFRPSDIVIDAYCGIGSIALYVADKVKKVYGVEIVSQAVKDACRNAEINRIENVEFITGAAEEQIPLLMEKRGVKPDVILVDPPRKGCDEALLQSILASRVEKVIYISCDPGTLARDLKLLCADDEGYVIKTVQPVDCFCQSWHVETVVLMSKKS